MESQPQNPEFRINPEHSPMWIHQNGGLTLYMLATLKCVFGKQRRPR